MRTLNKLTSLQLIRNMNKVLLNKYKSQNIDNEDSFINFEELDLITSKYEESETKLSQYLNTL